MANSELILLTKLVVSLEAHSGLADLPWDQMITWRTFVL